MTEVALLDGVDTIAEDELETAEEVGLGVTSGVLEATEELGTTLELGKLELEELGVASGVLEATEELGVDSGLLEGLCATDEDDACVLKLKELIAIDELGVGPGVLDAPNELGDGSGLCSDDETTEEEYDSRALGADANEELRLGSAELDWVSGVGVGLDSEIAEDDNDAEDVVATSATSALDKLELELGASVLETAELPLEQLSDTFIASIPEVRDSYAFSVRVASIDAAIHGVVQASANVPVNGVQEVQDDEDGVADAELDVAIEEDVTATGEESLELDRLSIEEIRTELELDGISDELTSDELLLDKEGVGEITAAGVIEGDAEEDEIMSDETDEVAETDALEDCVSEEYEEPEDD
ncbi:hypothetical protein EK21DRAFT_115235 [Setomelanomma holmii]|uniref:Uncharacterized protein n=1 Tax=Setomelanomma holmii TaxID=210430 RepID=A0A9P4H4S0_9PLEO|nr:hypothetical protein EK21DRAFT_115235 [Setomelanomma holmii]